MRELHPHQQQALNDLKWAIHDGKRRPIVQAATGWGKTVLASAIVDGALRKGNRVIFCVPQLSLIDQTVDAFWADGITDIGVIQADHERTSLAAPCQIASVQTLMRRDIPIAEVVIIDECHRAYTFVQDDWMKRPEWQKVPFIGLSATPWTKGLGLHYDDLIVAGTTADCIDRGFLSGYRVMAPDHPDLSGVKTVAGDYHEGQLSERMSKVELVANVVETWIAHAEQRPTLVFAVDRAHAGKLQQQFEARNIPCGYIDAYTKRKEREEIRKQFHSGAIKVVVNVGCLTMGVDWDVRCIVLARPTKSEILFVQIIGRGLRTAPEGTPDKDYCLILDHSDTHQRLGFVSEVHHEHLDATQPGQKASKGARKVPEPTECPGCRFLKPAGVHKCPFCGFMPDLQPDVSYRAGKLVEMYPGGKGSPQHRRQFYQQLRGYADDYGKSYKWVLANYKAKWDAWPPGHWENMPAERPTAEIFRWVKSRAIAWAKGAARRQNSANLSESTKANERQNSATLFEGTNIYERTPYEQDKAELVKLAREVTP